MSLKPSVSESKYEKAPAGVHASTCVHVIDIGTQKDNYMGEDKIIPKIMIGWELSGVQNSEGEPVVFYKEFSNFLSEKANLRKAIEAWFGKTLSPEALETFYTGKVVGFPCSLNIIHKDSKANPGRSYADMASIQPLANGQLKPVATVNHLVFDIDEIDMEVYNQIDEWIQKKIQVSAEWQKIHASAGDEPFAATTALTAAQIADQAAANATNQIEEDDIPF